jgi:hypothetical protein
MTWLVTLLERLMARRSGRRTPSLGRQHVHYSLGDESGYRFEIDASLDDEFGWNASVYVTSHGLRTAEDAVESLRPAVERLLGMLNETYPERR